MRLLAIAIPALAVRGRFGRKRTGLRPVQPDQPANLGRVYRRPADPRFPDLGAARHHPQRSRLLWRLHRVHHADTDIDVTTAIRFHPVEIALSMLLKVGAVYLLGPAALAVLVFEIVLNGCAMFNHANLKLSKPVDAILRLFLVTPDMHRVHHSDKRSEHDSNYGFSISLWDRVFKTYIPQPKDGHDDMTIGLQWQDERPTKLGWSLALPFFRK